ncbi:2Fe-2S iron-sulfur cluster binding domain-containing protein [Candidatus Fermentibacteria bacterium]|nr:2Fe-2S iron-sulfur cluster binding domain-containing protein [Candidatus Fermentibacteria bacterium]
MIDATPCATVRLTVNDRPTTVTPRPDETLVETLRRYGCADVKVGCGEGACGACTVAVDGVAVPSCLVLTACCDGCSIRTAAGLSGDPLARRIADALVEAGAIQCGFCAPGVLVTAWCLFSHTRNPDRETIQRELSGNLCRCGGSALMVEALAALA